MRKILCVLPITDLQKNKLIDVAKKVNAEIEFSSFKDVTASQVETAECVIGNVSPNLLKKAKNLKWLQTNSAGTDQYIVPGVLPEGVLLTNATGAYSPAVGEHMLAVTLMLMKNLHLYRDSQMNASWDDFGTVSSLQDATVLIVGAGDIGLHYAKLVKSLGAKTIGVRRREGEKSPYLDEVYLSEDVDKLLPLADVVASVLPGTAATEKFFSAKRFALMKKTGIFINAGRGTGVVQEDLLDALQTGKIAAASIDVTVPEPLPQEHPLWKQKNLILTPHISGGFHLPITIERIVNICCENIENYFNNKIMKNEVDFTTGYKK